MAMSSRGGKWATAGFAKVNPKPHRTGTVRASAMSVGFIGPERRGTANPARQGDYRGTTPAPRHRRVERRMPPATPCVRALHSARRHARAWAGIHVFERWREKSWIPGLGLRP